MDLVPDVEGKVFQSIEQGSQSGGLPRANPGERANSFLGEHLMDANGKDIAPMPWVSGGGSHSWRNCMAGRKIAGFQISPKTFTRESSHAAVRNVKDGLGHPSVPQFRFHVGLKPVSPFDPEEVERGLPRNCISIRGE